MARTASILTLARKLESARSALAAAVTAKQRELDQVDAALRRVLGGAGGGGNSTGNGRVARTPGRRGGRRGRRASSGQLREGGLAATIVEVLSKNGKGATIDEVLKGARKSGYKSKAKPATQKIMVNAALSRLVKTGHARKVGRGMYAAKA